MINLLYQRTRNYISNLPLIAWVLLGFFITFIWFFIGPILFDPSLDMQFYKYIPIMSPIGNDFRVIAADSSLWLHTSNPPTILYPSLTLIFFTPFTLFSYEVGYKVLTVITIVCYLLITFAIPQWINKSKDISAFAMLIFITGIVSYGFQFELERGQWNIIAFTFAMTALYIFHNKPKYRWLAYLLFTISIQLKLFPAIFVFAFIEDWSDWKQNIKRIVGLGIVNVLALFILGPSPILNTITSLVGIKSSHTGSNINLSITSFILYILSPVVLPRKRIFLWLMANNWITQLFLYVFFIICFLTILWRAYKKALKGFNPYIFLACSIGACIIPSISFDYKLSILPASIAISIPAILFSKKDKNGVLIKLLTFVFSIAYSSTLYSYTTKPPIMQNNLPALLVILTICTISFCIQSSMKRSPLTDTWQSNPTFNEP